jgi:predicted transcriptional regulator
MILRPPTGDPSFDSRRPGSEVEALDSARIAIYGCHMRTLKTTVYLDEGDYRRLKAIGREIRRSPAALVREAVSEFARKHGRRKALSLGVGHSGRGDVAERAEKFLEGMGEEKRPLRARRPSRTGGRG